MAFFKGKGTRAIRFLTVAYLIFLPLLYLAENYVGERHWLTTMAAYAPQYLFGLPLLLLLPWSLIGRHKKMLKLNLIAAAFTVFALMGFNVPWRSIVKPDGTPVRVMTYNIHHAMAGVDRVVEAIRAQSPDIVLMQETNAFRQYRDPVPPIQRSFPGWHIARAGEVAILSKYPITQTRIDHLAEGTDRVILSGDILINGKRLTLLDVHFNALRQPASIMYRKRSLSDHVRSASAVRREQAASVRIAADRALGRVLIAGDFNTPPRGVTYRHLTRRYRDAFVQAGWGCGFTYKFRARVPVFRIDHIFLGEGAGVRSCWVPRSNASDHQAVVADLVLR